MSGPGTAAPTWPRAVLFYLDGTLINSAPDIRAAVNELLARRNLGPLSLEQITGMIGNGMRKLVERALAATAGPLPPAELDAQYAAMFEIYGRHLTGLTTLIPGAAEALHALRRAGAVLGLVTNKPQRFIETIVDHFGLARSFGVVIGGDAGVPTKPAPDMLYAAMEQLGVEPEDTVMVGNSGADVQAARAADVVIGGLGELAGALPALKPPVR